MDESLLAPDWVGGRGGIQRSDDGTNLAVAVSKGLKTC
jgi:hypothetical protein